MYLTKLSQRNGNTDTEVSYSDLASVVQKKDSMEFLHDIIPKKVKYSEYCKLVEDSKDEEDDLFQTTNNSQQTYHSTNKNPSKKNIQSTGRKATAELT